MNKQTKINELLAQLDRLNDRFLTAIKHDDPKEIDRAGRDLILLGQVIKDTASDLRMGRLA